MDGACQIQDPLPETVQSLILLGMKTEESLEEDYCPTPSNSCGGVLYDSDVQSCVDGAVTAKTDAFACDMSSSVWCTADQACRDDMCFDLDELCSSEMVILCSFDSYDVVNDTGGTTGSPLRFICDGAEDICNEVDQTNSNGTGGGTPVQDPASAASFLAAIGKAAIVANFAAITCQIALF